MSARARSRRAAWLLAGLLLQVEARAAPPAPAAPATPSTAATPSKPRPKAGFVVPEAVRRQRTEAPAAGEALFALAPPEVLEALGKWSPHPGAWVEYEVRQDGHATTLVRLSVLPPALPEGRYWLEIAAASPESVPMAARLLVHGQPTHPEDVERTLLYIGGQAVLELPLDQTDGSFEPRGKGASGTRVKLLGKEEVKVRGGTFAAQRLQVSHGKLRATLWRADEVPILGLVKSEDAHSKTELIGHGLTGAHTVFPANQDPEGAPQKAAPPPAPASRDALQGNGSESKK